MEARASGLDTLVMAVDRARKGDVPGAVCTAYAEKLVTSGFRVCATDTISRETQTETWEADTRKPIEDVAITQEPTTEMA